MNRWLPHLFLHVINADEEEHEDYAHKQASQLHYRKLLKVSYSYKWTLTNSNPKGLRKWVIFPIVLLLMLVLVWTLWRVVGISDSCFVLLIIIKYKNLFLVILIKAYKARKFPYLGFPRRAAWCKALKPLLLVMVISALCSNKREIMSSRFLLMASCKAVSPSESWNREWHMFAE